MTNPEVQRPTEPLKLPTTAAELERLNKKNIGTKFLNKQRYKANFEGQPYDWQHKGRNIEMVRVLQTDGSLDWGYVDGHHRANAALAEVTKDPTKETFIKDIFIDETEKRLTDLDPNWKENGRELYLTKQEHITILASENNKQIEVSSKRTAAYVAIDGWEAFVGEETAKKVNALVAMHYLEGYQKVARSEWNRSGQRTTIDDYVQKISHFFQDNTQDDIIALRKGLTDVQKLIVSAGTTIDDVAKEIRMLTAPYGEDDLGKEIRTKLTTGLTALPGIQAKLQESTDTYVEGDIIRALSFKVMDFARERKAGEHRDMDPILEIIHASEDPLISARAMKDIISDERPSKRYKREHDKAEKAVIISTYEVRFNQRPTTNGEAWLTKYQGQVEPDILAERVNRAEDILRQARGFGVDTRQVVMRPHTKIDGFMNAVSDVERAIAEKKRALTELPPRTESVSVQTETPRPDTSHEKKSETKSVGALAETLTARIMTLGEQPLLTGDMSALRNLSKVLTAYLAKDAPVVATAHDIQPAVTEEPTVLRTNPPIRTTDEPENAQPVQRDETISGDLPAKVAPSPAEKPAATIIAQPIFKAPDSSPTTAEKPSEAVPKNPHMEKYQTDYGDPSPFATALLKKFARLSTMLPIATFVDEYERALLDAEARGVDTSDFRKDITMNKLTKQLKAIQAAQPTAAPATSVATDAASTQKTETTSDDASQADEKPTRSQDTTVTSTKTSETTTAAATAATSKEDTTHSKTEQDTVVTDVVEAGMPVDVFLESSNFTVPLRVWEHLQVGERFGTKEWFASKKNKTVSEQDKKLITEMAQAAARTVMNTKVPGVPNLSSERWHEILTAIRSREEAGLGVTVKTAGERFMKAAQALEIGRNDPIFRLMSAEYMLLALKVSKEQAMAADNFDEAEKIEEYENMFTQKIKAYVETYALKKHAEELTQIALLGDRDRLNARTFLKQHTPSDTVLAYVTTFKDADDNAKAPPFYFLDMYCTVTGVTKNDKISVTKPNVDVIQTSGTDKKTEVDLPVDMTRNTKEWFKAQEPKENTELAAVIHRAASRVLGGNLANKVREELETQRQSKVIKGTRAVMEKLSANILQLTQSFAWDENEQFDYICASFYTALLREQARIKKRQGKPYIALDDQINPKLQKALASFDTMEQSDLQYIATIPTYKNSTDRKALVTKVVRRHAAGEAIQG